MTEIKSLVLLGLLLSSLALVDLPSTTNLLPMANFDHPDLEPHVQEWLNDTSSIKYDMLDVKAHKELIVDIGNLLYSKTLESDLAMVLQNELLELKITLPTLELFVGNYAYMHNTDKVKIEKKNAVLMN